MRLGLSTTVVGHARLGAREVESIAAHGFSVVELAVRPQHFDVRDPAQVADVGAVMRAAGLEICAVSVPIAEAALALPGTVDLGCRRLVARSGACRAHGQAPRADAADAGGLRRSLEQIAVLAAERDVALDVEFPSAMAAEDIVAIIQSLDDAPIGVCLDVGHAHLTGGAPEAIEVLSGYIRASHLHDNQGREDSHRPPFAGSVDWPATLMALWKTGYSGPGILEIAPDLDVASALARAVGARTRLQAILDDLAQPMAFPE